MKRAIKIVLTILVMVAAVPVTLQALAVWRDKKEEKKLFEE